MKNLFDIIKTKLVNNLDLEDLVVINNSQLHKKHKSFDKNKFHLKLIITSKALRDQKKLIIHRKIYSLLKEELQNNIHALEIEIK